MTLFAALAVFIAPALSLAPVAPAPADTQTQTPSVTAEKCYMIGGVVVYCG